MLGPDPNHAFDPEAYLLGHWQCFEGDGIHGWDDKTIIFARNGDRFTIEVVRPAREDRALPRQFGPHMARCSASPQGVRAHIDDDEQSILDIWMSEPDVFRLEWGYAGHILSPVWHYYRRVS